VRIAPQLLSLNKVDTVFGEVSSALMRIESESHKGIKNIPFWLWVQSLSGRLMADFKDV
jgi:hypothetical protein